MQLMRREPDGASLREHLQAGAKATGTADPRLLRTMPRGGESLWLAYGDISGSRPPAMSGLASVPMSEVDAWQRLNGVRLTPWEVETLAAMDRAAVDVIASKKATQ